jgi:hypothetical protein
VHRTGAGQGQTRFEDSAAKTTWIYEGINQVQRIVMARQLLSGVLGLG